MKKAGTTASKLRISHYTSVKYAFDLALWVLASPFAFLLRLESGYFWYAQQALIYTILGLILKAILIYWMRLHRQSWHRVGIRDLFRLVRTILIGVLSLLSVAFLMYVYPWARIPRSIPLLEGALAVLMMGGIRMLTRVVYERNARQTVGRAARRVLVVGAGESGTIMVREMLRHPEAGMAPVGYLDDDLSKRRDLYLGYPVLGTIDDLPRVVRRVPVDEVLIAMPSAPGEVIRRVVGLARAAHVPHRIVPGAYDILSGKISISQIREVDVEDLLRRDPVRLDLQAIQSYLEGRVVLVTGAGGSIGSELVRQMIGVRPGKLILIDRDENNLYLFERELAERHPDAHVLCIVSDIQRKDKLERIFAEHRPQVVFHAAAHKHVPMMEINADEAVTNNVLGTQNLLQVSAANGVERFVNISTDKAVRPSSIMGASKRVAEYLVQQAASRAAPGQGFVSVRFGNVLGSRGSVVPIFKEQIRRGGPITVTHPDIARYFMSISEAAQLVLQAAALNQNGALYVLDMGEPVKIVDLARDLIGLSGLRPEIDIPIQYVGLRPGEKLHEELLTHEEGMGATRHEKIYIVCLDDNADRAFEPLLTELLAAAACGDAGRIRDLLQQIIPSYHPDPQG
jgi:FlaA1/EpsC-like NDP-sugar epimerase